ncbi:transporter substrate-binding domain-containing protein [Desulfobotulus sp. H1]|uniref:Transporter substrate-binding domain-containing protein n=1 Tax=Desulfobotulus pelophilus TaxID=2823377 RepID=A0ABT3NBM4_9BACT|nr:transporter substrate-binding domain-containing protein [Desulfobotulus pelophilus]MCW7754867.1 transporter substrate-binding domain-containing protein [Desulfobotulus pelophilus]
MKVKKMWITVVMMTLFLLSWQVAMAQEMAIFGNEARPPKLWKDGSEAKGTLVDIFRYAEPKLGVHFDFQLSPMSRALDHAMNQLGGITGFSKTEERCKVYDYSDVVYNDEVLLVVKKGREFPFEKLEDLKGKIISYQRGASYGSDFEKAKEYFKPHESNSPTAAFLFLHAERADAVVISPGRAAMHTILKDPQLQGIKDDFTALAKPLTVDPNYLAFHKGMEMGEFIERFNAVIAEGYRNGDIPKIIDNQ